MQKNCVILLIQEDISFFNATIVDMVYTFFDKMPDGIFVGHKYNLLTGSVPVNRFVVLQRRTKSGPAGN